MQSIWIKKLFNQIKEKYDGVQILNNNRTCDFAQTLELGQTREMQILIR